MCHKLLYEYVYACRVPWQGPAPTVPAMSQPACIPQLACRVPTGPVLRRLQSSSRPAHVNGPGTPGTCMRRAPGYRPASSSASLRLLKGASFSANTLPCSAAWLCTCGCGGPGAPTEQALRSDFQASRRRDYPPSPQFLLVPALQLLECNCSVETAPQLRHGGICSFPSPRLLSFPSIAGSGAG